MSDLEVEFLKILGNQFTTYVGREGGSPKPEALKEMERLERQREKELRLAENERRRQERIRQEQETIKRLALEAAANAPSAKFDQVARVVCAVHNVSMEAILADHRQLAITTARSHLMYLARKHLNMRWSEIGRLMCRDHSTIVSGVERFGRCYLDLPMHSEVLTLLSEVIPACAPDR